MGTCSDCTTYVQVGFMLCLQCALQILVSQAWDNRVCSAAKQTLRAKLLKVVLKSFLEIQVLKLNRILTEVFTGFFPALDSWQNQPDSRKHLESRILQGGTLFRLFFVFAATLLVEIAAMGTLEDDPFCRQKAQKAHKERSNDMNPLGIGWGLGVYKLCFSCLESFLFQNVLRPSWNGSQEMVEAVSGCVEQMKVPTWQMGFETLDISTITRPSSILVLTLNNIIVECAYMPKSQTSARVVSCFSCFMPLARQNCCRSFRLSARIEHSIDCPLLHQP